MPKDVHVSAHRRSAPAIRERQLYHYGRDMSRTDREKIEGLIAEVRAGRRAGYTYTGILRFDIDDPKSMAHVYDRLGPRTMHVIATTNRPAELLDMTPITGNAMIGPLQGIGLWRDEGGQVYADSVELFIDIDDDRALEIARDYDQFNILKVDGRTRSFAFLTAPGYDVDIIGQGKDRSFDPRPEL